MSWFRYVPHADLLWRMAQGWRYVADLGPPHSDHACLMQWSGEGEPA